MRIVIFGFDAAESSQIRRIRQFLDAGYEVSAFTMRRRNMNADFEPFWDNVHLFQVENERLGRRVLVLLLSLFKIAARLGKVRSADLLVARNFDLFVLAHAARLMALRPRLPIVYECLDIHAAFTEASKKGELFRRAERALLSRTELVVVSSPGFVENYLRPVQRYAGRVHLLENKVAFARPLPDREPAAPRGPRPPWRIGWVGSLRCEPSFAIITEAARRLGERVQIAFHGNIHHHVLRDVEGRLAALPNITYHGPYAYPDDLGPVYGDLDFVWAQDLWQRGANSDWLLPNRIYEASYFGCLSIAVKGTETGRTVEARGLGYVVEEPTADSLVALLDSLDPADVAARRARLLARPAEEFITTDDDIDALVEKATAPPLGAPRTASSASPLREPRS